MPGKSSPVPPSRGRRSRESTPERCSTRLRCRCVCLLVSPPSSSDGRCCGSSCECSEGASLFAYPLRRQPVGGGPTSAQLGRRQPAESPPAPGSVDHCALPSGDAVAVGDGETRRLCPCNCRGERRLR